MKLKVLFRVMVSRRDAIYCLLMKELLERKGCEVILTSGRGFVPAAKLWKPDIIITSTPAQALVCKEIAPIR